MTASTKAFFLVGLVLAVTLVSSFVLADATANGVKITGPMNDEKSGRQIRHGPSHDDPSHPIRRIYDYGGSYGGGTYGDPPPYPPTMTTEKN